MFWGSASNELITFLGLAASVFLVMLFFIVFAYRKKKEVYLFWVTLSILENLIVFLSGLSGSLIFQIYNLIWLQYFAIFIWPLINIFLLASYIKRK